MKTMISVAQAEEIIKENVSMQPTIDVPFDHIHGHVLREDIAADRDIPPFDRATMDGIALCVSAWHRGRREFSVAGVVPAGQAPPPLPDDSSCLEIMTGAMMPEGADCVVRIEDVTIAGPMAKIKESVELELMKNVHPRGSDCGAGRSLLQAGTQLLSPQVTIPASTGKTTVTVDKRPRIAIVATGDEIKDVPDDVEIYEIRQTNTHAMAAGLRNQGYTDVTLHHFRDDSVALGDGLAAILDASDVIILVGGVSMGKFDLVPEVLDELGITGLFHKVRQRPGKPFWFGVSAAQQPVYALPGNPVSALIGFHRFILPQLERSAGMEDMCPECAVLAEAFEFDKPLTYFLPVKLSFNAKGQRLAIPVHINGSGDFAGLVQSDGFVELDEGESHFAAGTVVRLFRWRC